MTSVSSEGLIRGKSALNVEFLDDGCDFLVGSQPCGHEWQTQLIVYKSHAVEHGFHTLTP